LIAGCLDNKTLEFVQPLAYSKDNCFVWSPRTRVKALNNKQKFISVCYLELFLHPDAPNSQAGMEG